MDEIDQVLNTVQDKRFIDRLREEIRSVEQRLFTLRDLLYVLTDGAEGGNPKRGKIVPPVPPSDKRRLNKGAPTRDAELLPFLKDWTTPKELCALGLFASDAQAYQHLLRMAARKVVEKHKDLPTRYRAKEQ